MLKKPLLALLGFFLLLYILPLGVRPMMVPDEVRYAEVPREMLASGDWVVPRLNGLRYFEKPVMGYWANALSMALFGQNAFAVRLPSALSAGASAAAVLLMVLRSGSGGPAAILSAAVLLTGLEVFAVGTFCLLDSILSFFLTGGMALFFFGFTGGHPGGKRLYLALSGIFFGLAFLTKGFLAFAVPLVSIVPFALWEKRLKDLLKCSWLPVAAALLIALPWALMIHLREPDFWHYFFWVEHLKRFFSDNAQHGKPLWYFMGVFAGGALPWTFLIPAAASTVWKARRGLPLIRFSLCWLLFPFIFFSLSHGKLATYILPCFPPFAVLTGIGVMGYLERGRRTAFVVGGTLLATMIALLAFALLWLQLAEPSPLRPYHEGETWKWAAGAAGLLLWVLLLVLALGSRIPWKRLAIFSVAPSAFLFSLPFIIPDRMLDKKAPGIFLQEQADKVTPDTLLVSEDDPLRAVCWTYRRDDVYVLMDPGEVGYGLSYGDSKHRFLDLEQLNHLVARYRGKKEVVLIIKTGRLDEYRSRLPRPAFEVHKGPFALVRFQQDFSSTLLDHQGNQTMVDRTMALNLRRP